MAKAKRMILVGIGAYVAIGLLWCFCLTCIAAGYLGLHGTPLTRAEFYEFFLFTVPSSAFYAWPFDMVASFFQLLFIG